MEIEFKTREIYDVTYGGVTKTFYDEGEARKYEHELRHIERNKYMDKLGIPKTGLCLVWTNITDWYGNSYAVLMYNRKCVASGDKKGNKTIFYTTHWFDSCSNFIKLDDIINKKEEYFAIWNSKFDRHDGAYHSYWGTDDDGISTFDYIMGKWNTKKGVNIEIL